MKFAHLITCAVLLGCSAPAPQPQPIPAPAVPAGGSIELCETSPVESWPDDPALPETHEAWLGMIGRAERSIAVEHFYASPAAPGEPLDRLEPVVLALEAAKERGVQVRFVADASFGARYPELLDRLARSVDVRRVDGKVAFGGGIQHAKLMVVDDDELYLGSANFDWRSLVHVQELGAHVTSAPLATRLAQLIAHDWALAGGEPVPPAPNAPEEVTLSLGGEPVRARLVASPESALPAGWSWELPEIVGLLDSARERVSVQLLDYRAANRDGTPFLDLDAALRRAKARGVRVELLLSHWSTKKDVIVPLQALVRETGIDVRLLTIPEHSTGFIPFARVAHAKYLVVDGRRAWLGTSNWSGDYFHKSRNVGLLLDGAAIGSTLERFFDARFTGPLAEKVDPTREYHEPRIGD